MQLSLEFPKGDPLETGISTIIHTHGLAVALYMIGSNKGTHLYCRLLTLGFSLDETRFMYFLAYYPIMYFFPIL